MAAIAAPAFLVAVDPQGIVSWSTSTEMMLVNQTFPATVRQVQPK